MPVCPRDYETLASNSLHGFHSSSCARCGGLWIPGSVLDRALSPAALQRLQPPDWPNPYGPPCPECQVPCATIVLAGVTLDRCVTCRGLWLDSGEWQRLKTTHPTSSQGNPGGQPSPVTDGLVVVDVGIEVLDFVANILS
jgi:Zn-finger nucleic acid-binding protein